MAARLRGGIDLDAVAALHRRAVDTQNDGQMSAALRLVRRGLRELQGVDADNVDATTLRMRLLITAAWAESELFGVSVGLARLDEAEQLPGDAPAADDVTSVLQQRALLLNRVGRLDEAIATFDRAEQHFSSARPENVAAVLLNRANASMWRGDLARARADLERCTAYSAEHDLVVLRMKSLHNLGYLRFLLGDLPGALADMDAASRLAREPLAIAMLDQARALAEAGLVREADERLAEASSLFRRDRVQQDIAETDLERARCALMLGEVRAARRLASSARDRFRRRGNDRWRGTAELVVLQAELAMRRPAERLLESALALRREFERSGSTLQARTAALVAAEAALALGDHEAAGEIAGALGPAGTHVPFATQLHSRFVRAAVHREAGQRAAAMREVRVGLRALADRQASFGSLDLQTASAVHGSRLASLGLVMAIETGRAATVLDASEQARAASTRSGLVRPPKDPIAAGHLAELRQVVEAIHAAGPGGADPVLVRKRRALERQVAAGRWKQAGAGTVRPVSRPGEIQGAIADEGDLALISYVIADGDIAAVVVTADGLRLQRLGPSAPVVEQARRLRADLDVLAQPMLPAGMRDAVISSARRSADALDAALSRPLGVEGQRLVIVPTGVLAQLPWSTLPSLRFRPIVVAPSATSWLEARRHRSRRRARTVFALEGPGMTHGRREIDGVRRAWKGSEVERVAGADRAALQRAFARGTVVHVAAHGTHQTENPLFSCLRLADGAVFAHELDDAGRTPEHVVLSACELGLATIRPGDEALGLTSVLLRLGSRSVVSGVARVNDELAAETMIDYHRRLTKGVDTATALADAIAAAPGPTPFVCFGAAWTP